MIDKATACGESFGHGQRAAWVGMDAFAALIFGEGLFGGEDWEPALVAHQRYGNLRADIKQVSQYSVVAI